MVLFVALFTSGLVSPLMTELAAVSQSIKGVGCECPAYLPMTSLTVRGARSQMRMFMEALTSLSESVSSHRTVPAFCR